MHSTAKLAIIFFYCLAVLYGLGYLIFFQGASAWWALLLVALLPHSSQISQWSRSDDDQD